VLLNGLYIIWIHNVYFADSKTNKTASFVIHK
jgi:hypothetical protein